MIALEEENATASSKDTAAGSKSGLNIKLFNVFIENNEGNIIMNISYYLEKSNFNFVLDATVWPMTVEVE